MVPFTLDAVLRIEGQTLYVFQSLFIALGLSRNGKFCVVYAGQVGSQVECFGT